MGSGHAILTAETKAKPARGRIKVGYQEAHEDKKINGHPGLYCSKE